jgi:integrase
MDQLPRNVASLVSPPPLDTRRVNPWDTSEVRQFISSIVGEEYEDLFITALGTGLRQSELLGLRKMNLSLLSDPPVVSVTETLQRYGQDFRFEEPKSKSSTRTIAIPSSVVTALKRQLSRTFDNQQLIGDEYEDWGLVFANINGTPLRDYVIRKRFYRIQEEAGLRRQRFHDLRHCYASFLLATGVNDQVLQENLGHSTIAITKNTYTHLMPSMKADAAEKLEELLFQN